PDRAAGQPQRGGGAALALVEFGEADRHGPCRGVDGVDAEPRRPIKLVIKLVIRVLVRPLLAHDSSTLVIRVGASGVAIRFCASTFTIRSLFPAAMIRPCCASVRTRLSASTILIRAAPTGSTRRRRNVVTTCA